MYGKLAMICFKYQVYLYGSEAITCVNAFLWVEQSITFTHLERTCAEKAIFYCPTMNSHRPRSQNTAKKNKL
jgi:hypothetical protein